MAAQCPENLLLRGDRRSLCTEPLAPYLETGGNPIKLDATSTACWRGYVGTWAIEGGFEGDRLYLVKLKGTSRTEAGWLERSLADLFPDYPDGACCSKICGRRCFLYRPWTSAPAKKGLAK